MSQQKNSVWRSGIRALLMSFFGILGLFVGLFVVVIALSALFGGQREINVAGHYTMLPDADGTKGPLKHDTPLILAIEIKGIIGTNDLDTESVRKQLERSQLHSLGKRIKGVLLLVNTPGGSVFDANGIYRLLEDYRKEHNIPIYVYADGLCASGGMYVACAADKVYASDVSLIGSVGVLAQFVNVSKGLEKIGVDAKLITRGTDKGSLNPLVPWKDGEDDEIQKIISYYYDDFVDLVADSRPHLSRRDLVEEYGARVFPAPVAQEFGYIDGVDNSRSSVLRQLVDEAGIGEASYQVIMLDRKTWLDQLIKGKWAPKLSLPTSGYMYLYEPAISH